jgi:hypothetical protein
MAIRVIPSFQISLIAGEVPGEEDNKEKQFMATWTQRANSDMDGLVATEGVANVNSVRAAISKWADASGAGQHSKTFTGTLRYPVLASALDREILSVQQD